MSERKRRLRLALRRGFERMMRSIGRPMDPHELRAAAIVFSPHPDDETLGCGGTIARKRRAGAPVTVVFMTDGSRSHQRFIAEDEMKSRRSGEARAACDALGVEPARVLFLNFKDGRLGEWHAQAVRDVREILRRCEVEQVFVPYSGDATSDHQATHSIVLAALRQEARRVVVYEYPVWFWHHWPWVSVPFSGPRQTAEQLARSLVSWLRLIKDLRCFVPTQDVAEQKRAALSRHRTQTVRLVPDAGWSILSDVAGGEFLECFFRQREVFYRHTI